MSKQVEKNVVRKPVRQGAPRERIRHAGVAQYGQAVGDHVTEQGATGYRGINPYTGKQGTLSELGNAVAERTVCGVGGSRTIHKSGSQSGLQDRSLPEGREIFPGFSGRK
jgi:hypothetical protein